jgi:N-acetylglucosamine malate deacetylase 1
MTDKDPPAAPNPYRAFVDGVVTATRSGQALPLGGLAPRPRPPRSPGVPAPTVMVLAPHPDDECITGALPLRLMRQAGAQVLAVPVTLGSNKGRRAGRLGELRGACAFLGFDVALPPPEAQERITPEARAADPDQWRRATGALAAIIAAARPALLLYPHASDWNRTHMGTHLLALDALALLPAEFTCQVAETEYWATMPAPNLLVESSAEEVADLVAAVAFYAGEVQRNPFHLRLPAWMQDNVRRGGEVVGGQGGAAPAFEFATLYRTGRWQAGSFTAAPAPQLLAAGADPAALLG